MNEILQKVKGGSGGQNTVGQVKDNHSSILLSSAEEDLHEKEFDSSGAMKDESDSTSLSSVDTSNKSMFLPIHINGQKSTNNGDEVHVSLSSHLITVEQGSTYTLTSSRSTSSEQDKETVSFQFSEESSAREDYGVNGMYEVSDSDILPDTDATMVGGIDTV